jgi:hypothetical protein
VSLSVKGLAELRRKLVSLATETPRQLGRALWKEGQELEAESVGLVPVDTGRLRASHYCAPPEQTADGISVEVGYGTDYGLAVHERIDVYHPVGEAKFLEIPLKMRAAGMAQRVADRVRSYVENGQGVDIAAGGSAAAVRDAARLAGAERGAKALSSRKAGYQTKRRKRIARSLRPKRTPKKDG